jgi:hypothetical protein
MDETNILSKISYSITVDSRKNNKNICKHPPRDYPAETCRGAIEIVADQIESRLIKDQKR